MMLKGLIPLSHSASTLEVMHTKGGCEALVCAGNTQQKLNARVGQCAPEARATFKRGARSDSFAPHCASHLLTSKSVTPSQKREKQ